MSFNGLLNQTATVENPLGSTDRHGQASFEAAQTIRVRAEKTSRTIATATRERAPIDIKFFAGPTVNVLLDARITYLSVKYRTMVVSPIILGNGKVHHYEILAQDWSYGA